MKDCCIIIPIYNVKPTESEIRSIRRNLTVLKSYDTYLIHPFLMDTSEYEEILIDVFRGEIENTAKNREDDPISGLFNDHVHFKPFKNKYFKSNKTYSRLLLSDTFYRTFLEYEYMLIAQTDTYILNTEHTLEEFLKISRERSYDYWGAPWPEGPFAKPYTLKDRFKLPVVKHPEQVRVGNGGFSLRHVSNTCNLVIRKRNLIDFYWRFNEDMFFSWFALDPVNRYRAASYEEASVFALESNMREEIEKGNIPYAVHAWEKYCTDEELGIV
ncbi:MAG: hypothetical protein IK123_04605 [Lachnospiraceae bacterium]|nr:hypothetical protein [Lachnospiraceae bacterium]